MSRSRDGPHLPSQRPSRTYDATELSKSSAILLPQSCHNVWGSECKQQRGLDMEGVVTKVQTKARGLNVTDVTGRGVTCVT